MNLPNSIDVTPKGKIVPTAKLGEPGYIENEEYQLNFTPVADGVEINYIGESGKYLDDEFIFEIVEKLYNET